MDKATLDKIRVECEKIEKPGYGEVTVKFQNGYAWRILSTCDIMIKKKVGEECPNWGKLDKVIRKEKT